jgi:excisionase family DNA binding protein
MTMQTPKASDRNACEISSSPEIIRTLREKATALKARDLARLLGVTPQHIYKMAAKGLIPSLRIGNAVRFDPGAIAEWLKTRLSTGPSAKTAMKIAV